MELSKDGNHYKLINRQLVDMGNSGMENGNITAYLFSLIELYVRPQKLGVTCDSITAFNLKSGNKRSPDISFISKDRLLGLKRLSKGYFQGAPDLAVEVISPNNTFEELHQKIVEYFANCCRLVWVINPDKKSILVYHKPQPVNKFRSSYGMLRKHKFFCNGDLSKVTKRFRLKKGDFRLNYFDKLLKMTDNLDGENILAKNQV